MIQKRIRCYYITEISKEDMEAWEELFEEGNILCILEEERADTKWRIWKNRGRKPYKYEFLLPEDEDPEIIEEASSKFGIVKNIVVTKEMIMNPLLEIVPDFRGKLRNNYLDQVGRYYDTKIEDVLDEWQIKELRRRNREIADEKQECSDDKGKKQKHEHVFNNIENDTTLIEKDSNSKANKANCTYNSKNVFEEINTRNKKQEASNTKSNKANCTYNHRLEIRINDKQYSIVKNNKIEISFSDLIRTVIDLLENKNKGDKIIIKL